VKKLIRFIAFLLLVISQNSAVASSDSIANALGWKTTHTPKEGCALCNGYYSEPKAIRSVPNPPNYKTVAITVTAKGPVIFRADGASVLQDDVQVKQPGRLAHADKAIVYHNRKTGKITDIKLIGHVRIQENGKLLIGNKADYNIAKDTITVNHAIYHITGTHTLVTITTPFDAWGTAKKIHRDAKDVLTLTDGKYSTCAPKDPAWVVSGSSMVLDPNTETGYAHNVVIRFKHVPIFYTPYYSFPLNAARKSGLLAPSEGYESGTGQQGFYFSQPWYWNIAPNYDFLFAPMWLSERGTQLNGQFRYLTKQSDGFLYASFLPDDREFASFRTNTLNTVSNNSSPAAAPYISQLADDSDNRYFINFENNVTFNSLWTGKFYARYISDSYYAENFQSDYLTTTTNQIPSFAELDYAGTHWQDTFLIQSYQTLHPLSQFTTTSPVENQYTRLPEWDFNAAYPQFADHFDFNLMGQAVNFDYNSAFSPSTIQMPIGERLDLQPSISRPFTWSAFYITPQLTADSTSYFSQLPGAGPNLSRPNFDMNRTLPIFDIDSGMYFNRFVNIGGRNYIQTLEPRIFYLYTPYLNQDNYPNFDTQSLPFSIINLYSLNEFTGFDRIQNANQMSFGLTSNLIRATNATDVLNAQVGFIDYFTTPSVCLVQGCQIVPQSISPITGALTWNPNALWSITSQAAWDSSPEQLNNVQLGAQYHFLQHHIILLNYQFTHSNLDTPFSATGLSPNDSLLTAGLVWPIALRWHFFGFTYYNLTQHHPQNQFLGLSYNTCCWALRFIFSNDYNGNTTINNSAAFQSTYTNTYYLQFLLKGLGSVGNHNAENMLMNSLPGYQDSFSNSGHYGYSQTV